MSLSNSRPAWLFLFSVSFAPTLVAVEAPSWPQWRGPSRDGQIAGPAWPRRLGEGEIKSLWRTPLAPGYSGPIVSDQAVFVTETADKKTEVVRALDRRTGAELWRHSWAGAITVSQ